MPTKSEVIFEGLCDSLGIKWKRVTEGPEQTPDYDIFLPRRKVVVEVKEIVPNKEELAAEQELKNTGFASSSTTPGKRVRDKISEANRQIKKRANGKFPGLLVLYDRGFVARHLDPYCIRVAMCGFETIQIAVPNDPRIRPYAVEKKHGGRRKMTPNDNTSISAIAVVFHTGPHDTHISIYHNDYAKVPLDPKLFSRYGVKQHIIERGNKGGITSWKELP